MSSVIDLDDVAELYRQAFSHVVRGGDWQGPIDCVVPVALAELYEQAIEFMTGAKPNRTTLDTLRCRLHCIGYRLSAGGKRRG